MRFKITIMLNSAILNIFSERASKIMQKNLLFFFRIYFQGSPESMYTIELSGSVPLKYLLKCTLNN